MADKNFKEGAQGVEVHSIRITLSSTNVKNLEKVVSDLKASAKSKDIKVRGPVRLPTKHLVITTRKAPSGNGTATWDRFEMRVHKRLLDMTCAPDVVKEVTSINIIPGVDVEVTIDA